VRRTRGKTPEAQAALDELRAAYAQLWDERIDQEPSALAVLRVRKASAAVRAIAATRPARAHGRRASRHVRWDQAAREGVEA
jgi:hypothetical protein